MHKARELAEELKNVVLGKNNLIDVILPTLVFLALDAFAGFNAALWGSLIVAAGFAVYRVLKKQSPLYALVGLGLAPFATLSAFLSATPQVAFLPGLLTNALTVAAALISITWSNVHWWLSPAISPAAGRWPGTGTRVCARRTAR